MAKEPAFLFYSSDFLTGTSLFSNEQVGKYIRLLCHQHQTGKLYEEDMIKICGTYDKDIFRKFIKDEKGMFFNQRLDNESTKRTKYCESRRNNRLKKENEEHMSDMSLSYVPRMENEDLYIHTISVVDSNSNSNSINNISIINEKELKKINYLNKWNQFAKKFNLSTILKISPSRDKHLSARIKERLFDFDLILEKCSNSDFLKRPENNWFSFDWILNGTNYIKVLEGKYDNKPILPNGKAIPKQSWFNNYNEYLSEMKSLGLPPEEEIK